MQKEIFSNSYAHCVLDSDYMRMIFTDSNDEYIDDWWTGEETGAEMFNDIMFVKGLFETMSAQEFAMWCCDRNSSFQYNGTIGHEIVDTNDYGEECINHIGEHILIYNC